MFCVVVRRYDCLPMHFYLTARLWWYCDSSSLWFILLVSFLVLSNGVKTSRVNSATTNELLFEKRRMKHAPSGQTENPVKWWRNVMIASWHWNGYLWIIILLSPGLYCCKLGTEGKIFFILPNIWSVHLSKMSNQETKYTLHHELNLFILSHNLDREKQKQFFMQILCKNWQLSYKELIYIF